MASPEATTDARAALEPEEVALLLEGYAPTAPVGGDEFAAALPLPRQASNSAKPDEPSVKVTVELGRAQLPRDERAILSAGMLVKLEKQSGDLVDVYAGDRLVARGEMVIVNECFGVRVCQRVDTPPCSDTQSTPRK